MMSKEGLARQALLIIDKGISKCTRRRKKVWEQKLIKLLKENS